jgi:hypothetical protein
MAGISKLMPAALGYDIGEVVIAAGSFRTNATDDPSTFRGDIISSVTETGTGLFTVTVRDLGYEVLACVPSLQLGTVADKDVMLTGIDTSALTLTIQTVASSTGLAVAAPASDATNWVHLILVLRRTSVARRRT